MSLVVERPLSVWWEVYLLTQGFQKSDEFRVRRDLWFFECGEDSANDIDLYLCHLSRSPSEPLWSVTIQVKGNGRDFCKELYQRTDDLSTHSQLSRYFRTRIWSRKTWDIKRLLPDWQRQLTFRVTISDKEIVSSVATQPSTCASRIFASRSVQTCLPGDTLNASVQTSPSTNPDPCFESLSADLAKMLLEEGSDPDIKLHCEGLATKAHKNILCARSPVLAKMLNSKMKEGSTGVANIEDMTADTFSRFLKYLYTSRLDSLDSLTFESALSLYETGDMYEVHSLKRFSSHFLIANLTVENACPALAVAEAHSDAELEETVTAYILENDIPLSGDLWSGFCDSHPKLANKVYGRFFEKLSKRM